IGTPASPCLSTAMIWVSVNFDFFIQPPGGEKMPESSTYWVSTDRGSLRHHVAGVADAVDGLVDRAAVGVVVGALGDRAGRVADRHRAAQGVGVLVLHHAAARERDLPD